MKNKRHKIALVLINFIVNMQQCQSLKTLDKNHSDKNNEFEMTNKLFFDKNFGGVANKEVVFKKIS